MLSDKKGVQLHDSDTCLRGRKRETRDEQVLCVCFTYPMPFPRVHYQGRTKRPRRIHTAAGKWNLENKEINQPFENRCKQTRHFLQCLVDLLSAWRKLYLLGQKKIPEVSTEITVFNRLGLLSWGIGRTGIRSQYLQLLTRSLFHYWFHLCVLAFLKVSHGKHCWRGVFVFPLCQILIFRLKSCKLSCQEQLWGHMLELPWVSSEFNLEKGWNSFDRIPFKSPLRCLSGALRRLGFRLSLCFWLCVLLVLHMNVWQQALSKGFRKLGSYLRAFKIDWAALFSLKKKKQTTTTNPSMKFFSHECFLPRPCGKWVHITQ